ncbi:MAG: YidC/Oxa1 family insertase periplasmic-domain containing protein [Nitrospiraceae bacterium]|nr:YidC/Oxa1 family insertase periplasmic-domain containing protein [Nitrospiraceae bacterium]
MDKRFAIALLLTSIVVIVTPLLFPSSRRPAPKAQADTSQLMISSPDTAIAVTVPAVAPSDTLPSLINKASVADRSVMPAETTAVDAGNARLLFSSIGARLLSVELREYKSFRVGKPNVIIRGANEPIVKYRLVSGTDTTDLDRVPFTREVSSQSAITYRTSTSLGDLVLSYEVVPDSYLVRVSGTLNGPRPAELLIALPGGIHSEEADTIDDRSHLAFAVKSRRDDARRIRFHDLDPGESDTIAGPIVWVASKNKYFLTALLAKNAVDPFSRVIATGSPRVGKAAPKATILVSHPALPGQPFAFEIYAGPQEWRRLHDLGSDFENVNPYGGFMQALIQPFATIVMRVLLWMRTNLKLSYGWVLVLFGIAVRIVLWPLNQSAMRTSLRMQRIQPQLTAVQAKYRNNAEKQREEIMRVYREHGMTPFSPLMGCLPMLLPMPVLFALFFVFQNTIEFRGVPFLWLPDISQADPLYIIPIVMGLSMYVLSWIGMRNAPPNPQAKMMGYVLPVMMTVLFWRFASGLNLYYTVQNIAALPQQWLIARERGKPTESLPVSIRA